MYDSFDHNFVIAQNIAIDSRQNVKLLDLGSCTKIGEVTDRAGKYHSSGTPTHVTVIFGLAGIILDILNRKFAFFLTSIHYYIIKFENFGWKGKNLLYFQIFI